MVANKLICNYLLLISPYSTWPMLILKEVDLKMMTNNIAHICIPFEEHLAYMPMAVNKIR
jgi:hypothetical protein